jgi:hypothetical protein
VGLLLLLLRWKQTLLKRDEEDPSQTGSVGDFQGDDDDGVRWDWRRILLQERPQQVATEDERTYSNR